MVQACLSRTLSLDNFSQIPKPLSDALCRLSTGGVIAKRKLYTDSGIVRLKAQRPVIITSINDLMEMPDLRSRTLFLELPRIQEGLKKSEIDERFMEMRPRVLGALLDALVAGLQGMDDMPPIPDYNHLSDFTSLSQAAEETLGFDKGAFETAFRANRLNAIHSSLQDGLPQAIVKIADKGFDGILKDLCETLPHHGVYEYLPTDSRPLKAALERHLVDFEAVGISVDFPGRTKRGVQVTIQKTSA
jgi:hypothetical protein